MSLFTTGADDKSAEVNQSYMREHLSEQVSLASIAEVAGRSERHLFREFRISVGTYPINYIRSRGIKYAQ